MELSPPFTPGNFPAYVGFLDVDLDGKLDVVTANDKNVSYYLNQGNKTFAARVDQCVGNQPEGLGFTDLNGRIGLLNG